MKNDSASADNGGDGGAAAKSPKNESSAETATATKAATIPPWNPNASSEEFIPSPETAAAVQAAAEAETYWNSYAVASATWNQHAAAAAAVDYNHHGYLDPAAAALYWQHAAAVEGGGDPAAIAAAWSIYSASTAAATDGTSDLAAFPLPNADVAGAEGMTKESPRSMLLTLCGAWGALSSKKPITRNEMMKFRCNPDGEAPKELVDGALKCIQLAS